MERFQFLNSRDAVKGLSDREVAEKIYDMLMGNDCDHKGRNWPKLSKRKAFNVIWFLQEVVPIIPDSIEQCSVCGDLYDSYSAGEYCDVKLKHYCDSHIPDHLL